MKRTQRIEWLDEAKGLAALLVVLGHITNGYLTAKHFQEWKWLINAVHYVIYAFHMPLFMALSGYAFYRAYCLHREEKRRSYRVQLLNIALLYFIFASLKWASQMLLSDFVAIPVTIDDLIWMGVKPLEELWYLYVLFFLYVIAYAAERLRLSGEIKLGAAFALSALSVFVPWHTAFPIDRILYYAFFFYLGMYLAAHPHCPVRRGLPAYALGSVAAAVYIVRTGDIRGKPLAGIAAASLMSLLTLSLMLGAEGKTGAERGRVRRLLAYLGGYSLEIYVMHCYVISAGRAILPKLGVNHLFVSAAIIFPLAVFLPLLGTAVLKRLSLHAVFFRPAQSLLRRIGRASK